MTADWFTRALADAYEQSADAWPVVTSVLYGPLAEALVSLVDLRHDDLVLDVCCGTGAVTTAMAGRHRTVAVDLAPSMVAAASRNATAGVVADGSRLPFRDASFAASFVAFGLNHSLRPTSLLMESGRVAAGGVVAASVFASGWDHPAKTTVDDVLVQAGWSAPAWHRVMKTRAEPPLGTVEGLADAARLAGLAVQAVERVDVPTMMDPGAAIAWRWSMASHAPFVRTLSRARRAMAWKETSRRLEATWAPVTVPMLALVAAAPERPES